MYIQYGDSIYSSSQHCKYSQHLYSEENVRYTICIIYIRVIISTSSSPPDNETYHLCLLSEGITETAKNRN